jgi:hypothetical protein
LDDGVPGVPPGMMGVDGAPETAKTRTYCNLEEQINTGKRKTSKKDQESLYLAA